MILLLVTLFLGQLLVQLVYCTFLLLVLRPATTVHSGHAIVFTLTNKMMMTMMMMIVCLQFQSSQDGETVNEQETTVYHCRYNWTSLRVDRGYNYSH